MLTKNGLGYILGGFFAKLTRLPWPLNEASVDKRMYQIKINDVGKFSTPISDRFNSSVSYKSTACLR
jgi:hypothetical protein